MKLFRQTATAVAFAALTAFTVNAQQQQRQQPAAGGRPATQSPAAPATNAPATGGTAVNITEAKIAVINTEAFGAQQGGIGKLVNAMSAVDREFEPRRKELQGIQANYNKLIEDINKIKGVAKQEELTQKGDQAERLKLELERKQQDAQRDFEKRMREAIGPLQQEVYNALDKYAKEKGITLIIDASQVPVLYAVDAINITGDFIAYYNKLNPATAAASTTTTPRQ